MSFSDLGLSAGLLRAVSEQGYTEPTPVQSQSIPLILAGRDLLARAQTGTGKTAGFTLPMLQRLDAQPPRPGKRPIRCLILTPTRELAAQVQTSVADYGKYSQLRSTVLVGGVSIRPQIAALARGVDIVVATPGRLLDHLNQRTAVLSQVEILVLDEADRMLDMGFINDIKRVLKALPREKQSLLFSATFSAEIKQLASGLLNNPAEVAIAPQRAAADLIEQHVYPVDKSRKRDLLAYLIGSENWRQVLVFTRTKHGANRLAAQLESDGLKTTAIHGNKSQAARTKALADFKRGAVRVLVATDIAARGLDIDQLPKVVNFELPEVAEDYVHRIGRTGRAGCEGSAVSLVCIDELGLLRSVESLIKQKLDRIIVPGFEPDPNARPEPREQGSGQRRGGGRPGGGRPGGGGRPSARPGGNRPRPQGQHARQRSGGGSNRNTRGNSR
jgi:ATP-dependent RNA helicase RhlE